MIERHNTVKSIDTRVLDSIRKRGRGSVFVPADFLQIGSRRKPSISPSTGSPGKASFAGSPAASTIFRNNIRCWADFSIDGCRRQSRWRAATAPASNRPGRMPRTPWAFPNRSPPRAVFLTDGPSRTVRIGGTTIQLRRTTAKNMAAAGRLSGLLIQALRHLGEKHVTPERRAHLRTVHSSQKAPRTYEGSAAGTRVDAPDLSGTCPGGRTVKTRIP